MHRLRSLLSSPLGSGVLGGVVALALGIAVVTTGLIPVDNGAGRPEATTVAQAPIETDAQAASGTARTVGQVYDEDAQGVVFVSAEQEAAGAQAPLGSGGGGTATGSGFLIDDAGHIVTNAHVVDGASSVSVTFGDGEALDAEVLGADDSTDVAVLRVDPSSLVADPLELGDSDAVRVGDAAVAIGNPYGLDRTVTSGIISALQRQISAPNGFTISDVLQTDAAINPGNSGGPLIDSEGRVIGINSQIATGSGSSGSVGIGFAVPINTAKDVAAQIIEDGSVEHAWLGIQGGDLDPAIADELGLEVDSGALVGAVTPGGPAEDAGLRGGEAGDVITAVDGEAVAGMDEVIAAVDARQPGDTITLEVLRDGSTERIEVVLGNRPAEVES